MHWLCVWVHCHGENEAAARFIIVLYYYYFLISCCCCYYDYYYFSVFNSLCWLQTRFCMKVFSFSPSRHIKTDILCVYLSSFHYFYKHTGLVFICYFSQQRCIFIVVLVICAAPFPLSNIKV